MSFLNTVEELKDKNNDEVVIFLYAHNQTELGFMKTLVENSGCIVGDEVVNKTYSERSRQNLLDRIEKQQGKAGSCDIILAWGKPFDSEIGIPVFDYKDISLKDKVRLFQDANLK